MTLTKKHLSTSTVVLKPLFPKLICTCLKTAEICETTQLLRGKTTVVDFWTTSCGRCPPTLDKLDQMAQEPRCANLQFISICCDSIDKARDTIEKDDYMNWPNIKHFHIDPHHKKVAKQLIGFQFVPFCVIVSEDLQMAKLEPPNDINFHNLMRQIPRQQDTLHPPNSSMQNLKFSSTISSTPRSFVLTELDF